MLSRTATYNSKAPSLRIWHEFDLAQHVGSPRCVYPFFELDKLKPVAIHHLASQDRIFVPSYWAMQVIQKNLWDRHGNCICPPIDIVRAGVDTSIFRPSGGYVTQGPTTFLNIGKWEVRKGHDVLLDAFNMAFEPNDQVKLIMNCSNPCSSARIRTAEDGKRYNDDWAKAYKNSRLGSKIQVIEQRLPSQNEVALLMGQVDCGVFPSRGEGWNLEALEMMAMGKSVILTDYSAHAEFAKQDNSLLISVDGVEEAYDGHWFDPDDASWGNGPAGCWAKFCEPQLDQLVHHLRTIHRKKQNNELKPNLAGIETAKRLSWDATVKRMLEAL